MKAAIFSQGESESSEILADFFRRRSVDIDQFSLLQDKLDTKRGRIFSLQRRRFHEVVDYRFCYGRTWGDFRARKVHHEWVRDFTRRGVPALDPLEGILNNDNKLLMLSAFAAAAIPTPVTIGFNKGVSLGILMKTMAIKFSKLVVIKADGSGGEHVHFVPPDDIDAISSVLNRYCSSGCLNTPLVLQEYVESKNATGQSYHYRAIVVEGRPTVLMRFRAANQNSLASNIAKGAVADALSLDTLTIAEMDALGRACEVTKISIAGVDFLKTERGLFILEVNNSPGLNTAYKLGATAHLEAIVAFAKSIAARCSR